MDRFAAIRNKTREVLARAKELYGVDINPTISFNLRGRVAGWAGCKLCRLTATRNYTLRYNRGLIDGNHFDDMMNETVPHEVAHLVCYARPELGRKHDGGWRRVCLALGGNGNTRHDYDVTYAHGGYTYRATCGTEVTVSKIIHGRIQAGQSRTLRRTGGRLDKWCAWAPAGRPLSVPVQPV
jgi:SprT protein